MIGPQLDAEKRHLILGRRLIALEEIEGVELDSVHPNLTLALLSLLVGGVLGIPALNFLGDSPERGGVVAVGIVIAALLVFSGIYGLIGAADRYRVWLRLGEGRLTVFVTADQAFAEVVLTDLRKWVGPPRAVPLMLVRPEAEREVA
ncbi:MAG: DUF6232 family protein [Myxococcota bacterium]|nr:DUF6232 family protein [Myxococcota bacterium]